MIDAIDQAQELEERYRADAIAHRHAAPCPGKGADTCERCHGAIQEQRCALGYRICVDCATRIERHAAGHR